MGYQARISAALRRSKQAVIDGFRPGKAPLRPRRGQVMVGFPMGGSVTAPFFVSIIKLLDYEHSKATPLLSIVKPTQGLYVADNRTLIAQRFLDSGLEWLLQIDTDIEFPPDILGTLLRLAGEDIKILAASVPLGQKYATSAFVLDLADQHGIWRNLPSVPKTPMECDGVATAMLLVHRDVFRGIAAVDGQSWFHHFYLPDPKNKPDVALEDYRYISQGEDIAFCVRAKRCGFKVYCVHVAGLRHHKTVAFSHDYALTQQMAQSDAAIGELVQEG